MQNIIKWRITSKARCGSIPVSTSIRGEIFLCLLLIVIYHLTLDIANLVITRIVASWTPVNIVHLYSIIIVSGSETIEDNSSQNNKDIILIITKCKSRPQLPTTPHRIPFPNAFPFPLPSCPSFYFSNSDNVIEKMSFWKRNVQQISSMFCLILINRAWQYWIKLKNHS